MPDSVSLIGTRRRAGIVCVACHARKVKCDLQERPSGQCRNCQKANQPCEIRRGLRKRSSKPQPHSIPLPTPPALDGGDDESANLSGLSMAESNVAPSETRPSGGVPENAFLGYLGEQSFLSNSCRPKPVDQRTAETVILYERILQAADATSLPSSLLINALADVYFTQVFPHVPVVDRCDLASPSPSTLLLQSVCLIGSYLRNPESSYGIPTASQFYQKVKTLLSVNYEKESLTVLKSICLVACRSADLPTSISLDSGWHWMGVAIRYALNMGLHREATYRGSAAAGTSRRIWWHLFNTDKLQSLCYGRPPAIRSNDFDLRLPTKEDFAVPHPDNDVFIERTKLCVILGKASDVLNGRQQQLALDEATKIGEYLRDWIHGLPDALRLYDGMVRKPYRRAASELHIIYFTCVILFFRLLENPNRSSAYLKASVVASSCMTRLLEEIYYRGEVHFLLPINNWYAMVASVPQIHALVALQENKGLRSKELQMIRLVLQQMAVNIPSSNLILNNIDRVQESSGNGALAAPIHNGAVPGVAENDPGIWTFRRIDPPALFPFPEVICPSMDLLKTNDGNQAEPSASTPATSLNQGVTEWMFNFDFCDVQLDGFPVSFGVGDNPFAEV